MGMKTEKRVPIPDDIEFYPDATERFERAVDAVMRSPPKPRIKKTRAPSPTRGGTRDGSKPA
jgi:hypothetical protein